MIMMRIVVMTMIKMVIVMGSIWLQNPLLAITMRSSVRGSHLCSDRLTRYVPRGLEGA